MKPSIQSTMSDQEMRKLHETSLTILETVGMQIDHARSAACCTTPERKWTMMAE
ncbi:MAG: hypothetical protein QNK29_00095 [Desulfobacterales bacterium]|nr:hypothetical protein [Desulfobacterales bacterium]MDX2510430.1 hypothetical protein [Desulfobacterales bacterium]